MNPIRSKSIQSSLPRWFPAAIATASTRACPRLLASAALCLLALPGVSRADTVGGWNVAGTETWTSTSGGTGDGLRTVTGQMKVGDAQLGILNQTGGTINTVNVSWGTIIGQGGGASGSTYNMSGDARYLDNQGTLLGNGCTATWTLSENAYVSIAYVDFGNGGNGNSLRLLLSDAATFSATSLYGLAGTNEYISFATGSTATFTAGNMVLGDYQTLVASGKIRVDGMAASMSQFQVVDHTLSLSTGGPTPPHLVISSVDPASPTAGTGFSVTVEAQDESNVPTNLTADTEVTLTRNAGTGTLGGTTTGTILNGTSSVTISGITYTKAESSVVLRPGGGLAGLDSAPFTVVPGAAAKLAFGIQPSATSTGAAIAPAVTVLVQDENGNTVTDDTRSVTIGSSTTGFSPGSVLSVSAVDGVATFDTIEPTTEGSGNTLTASDGLLIEATSALFTVGADTVGGWTIVGTVYRNSSRTVTGQLTIGHGSTGPGILNQTGGTINTSGASWGTIIGQGGGASGSTYNMSGNAIYLGNGTTGENPGVLLGNETNATWTLTDSANASITGLIFSNGGNGYANHLLLSGAATFSATSLTGLTGANQYISFATGSPATFTADNMDLAAYRALVANGNIRVDGVVQTDFSKFQVDGNTLSLGSGGASPYASWAGGHAFDALNGEGVPYGLAWILGATTNASPSIGLLPTVAGASGGLLTVHFTRVLDPGATAKLYLEYSDDLGTWTSVEVPATTGPVSGVEFNVGTSGGLYDITAQIPMDSSTTRFARLAATE